MHASLQSSTASRFRPSRPPLAFRSASPRAPLPAHDCRPMSKLHLVDVGPQIDAQTYLTDLGSCKSLYAERSQLSTECRNRSSHSTSERSGEACDRYAERLVFLLPGIPQEIN